MDSESIQAESYHNLDNQRRVEKLLSEMTSDAQAMGFYDVPAKASPWIDISKHGKPDHDAICLVTNKHYLLRYWKTIYSTRTGCFMEDNPHKHDQIPIDATHYIELKYWPSD